MRAWLTVLPALLALYSLGCQQLPGTGDDDDDNPPPSSTTDGGTLLPGDNGQEGEMADAESGESESLCDPVAQTGCPSGEKCTAIISGGVVVYGCVADPGGLDPNSPCQASTADGIDGCPAGTACLQDEAGNGICTALCEDSADCTQAQCIPSQEDGIPYCATTARPSKLRAQPRCRVAATAIASPVNSSGRVTWAR